MSALALTSCNKLGSLSADDFKVTPTPLVVQGGEVPATITVTYPEKYMKKKASVVATPVLKFANGEAASTSAEFQGEKVEGNGTEVNYKLGGTYTMKANWKYTEDMLKSDLYMRFDAKVGKKSVSIPDVKVGYGVVATSELLGRCLTSANAAQAQDQFQRVVAQKQEANIKFLIAQSKLRNSETNSTSMKDLVKTLKEINDNVESRALNGIEVSAYASPDGKYSFNEKLAEKRQNTSAEFLKKELKRIKLDADINTRYTAEDWDGFQELIAASNIQDKNVILSVLSMYQDPEEREAQIKNMSEIYTDIKTGIMPELRRARLMVNYEVIGRSDKQIQQQYKDDASKLSVEEMIYAANMLAETPSEQKEWNQKITQLYPNDFRAYNNLAQLAYNEGDINTAKQYLAKAQSINKNAAEVNTNLGLIALTEGDAALAEQYLASGSGANSYDEILGALNLAKGNYTTAVANLAKSNTNTAALAQILSEDYASAKSTLANIKKADATTSYLQAILAARTNDTSTLVSSLKSAISQDRSLAERAANDLEFANFTSTVKSLLK